MIERSRQQQQQMSSSMTTTSTSSSTATKTAEGNSRKKIQKQRRYIGKETITKTNKDEINVLHKNSLHKADI